VGKKTGSAAANRYMKRIIQGRQRLPGEVAKPTQGMAQEKVKKGWAKQQCLSRTCSDLRLASRWVDWLGDATLQGKLSCASSWKVGHRDHATAGDQISSSKASNS
jgi:hypothetical protein